MTSPSSSDSPAGANWATALLRAHAVYVAYQERQHANQAEAWEDLLAAHRELGEFLISMRDGESEAPAESESVAFDPQQPLGEVDRFELLEPLGRGGYGVVYLARDRENGLRVALKLLNLAFADEVRRKRFELEATTLRTLSHSGICPIIDFRLSAAQPWIAMRYVPGATLDKLLAACPKPSAAQIVERVAMLEKVTVALHYAHANGFLHRDIKPSNIMVTPEGSPVLLDFGLARPTVDDAGMTLTGMALGSPPYMAPERHVAAPDDVRAEVWSLGVVLYESLAGERPFEPRAGETWTDVVRAAPRRPLRRENVEVPAALADIVDKALRPDPRDRYQSAGELADDLRRWLRREPVHARRAGMALRSLRWAQRQPLAASLMASLLGAALVIGAVAWYARDVAAEESRARAELAAALSDLRSASGREAFNTAVKDASYGRWEAAELGYARAAELGFDAVALELGRIELLDATFASARAEQALRALTARQDLGAHAPMVALLENDPTRPGSPEVPEDWSRRLSNLVSAQSLPRPWHHYARALLAKTLPAARAALDQALEADARHRPSNEMRWSVVLLTQGPEVALVEARRFAALYPEDPLAALMQALSLQLSGRAREADALLANAQIPRDVREVCEFLIGFRDRLHDALQPILQAGLAMQLGGQPDAKDLGMAGISRLFSGHQPESLQDLNYVPRLPPATSRSLKLCMVAVTAMNVGGSRRVLDDLLRDLPFGLFFLFRANTCRKAGDLDQALRDLSREPEPDLFGLDYEVAMLRVLLVGYCLADLSVQPERLLLGRRLLARAISDLIAMPRQLDAPTLRHLAARAADLGDAPLVQECALRLRRDCPDDPDSAVFVAGELLRVGQPGTARDLAAQIRAQWPTQGLPATLVPTGQ